MADKLYVTAKELFESEIEDPEWLVDKIIQKKGITLFAGEQATSKSLLALHIAICVATGKPVLGKFPVKKGRVLYIDEENREIVMKYRVIRMILGTDESSNMDIDFMICKNVKLDEEKKFWKVELQKYIKERKPVLIICDSMVRMMVGDENSSRDVRRIYDTIKDLGVSWLLLHHTAKAGKTIKSVRGSGDFVMMCDDVFKLKRHKGKHTFALMQEKSRGASWISGFEYQILGREFEEIKLKYLDEVKEEQVFAGDKLAEEVKEWLKTSDVRDFKTGLIVKQFKTSNDTAREALTNLAEDKIIESIGKGKWRKIE